MPAHRAGRSCAGLITSTDFETWEVQPPLFAPGRFWDLECPQIFTINGTFYLTAAIMEDRTQRYWMASAFEGPYRVPPDGGFLAPRGHNAGRVCTWRGQVLYFCWHLPPNGHADWITARNPHGKYIVAPLTLSQRPDGSLVCGSFPGWAEYELDSAIVTERDTTRSSKGGLERRSEIVPDASSPERRSSDHRKRNWFGDDDAPRGTT